MSDPRPALGTAQLGGSYGIASRGAPSAADATAILRAALDAGIRWVDTAPQYGEAETRIGRFLQREGRPEDLRLCTKLPRLPSGLSPGEVDRAVGMALGQSRRNLATDAIACYWIHAPVNLAEYGQVLLDSLAWRRDAGVVGRIGVTVYTPTETSPVPGHEEIDAVQFPFNLFDRRMTSGNVLGTLRRRGCAMFARSPLLQGLLGLAPDTLPPPAVSAGPWLRALGDLCRAYGTNPVAAALGFAAARSGADYVVLGVDSVTQLREALMDLQQPLPFGLAEAIEERFPALPEDIIDPRRWRRPES